MKVVIVTHLASPYQVELFNAVAASGEIKLQVVYLRRTSPTRHWTVPPLSHGAVYLDQDPCGFQQAQQEISSADLAIFNYYTRRPARVLLNARAASGKAWCFWGERPGYRKPEWIGRIVRRRFLSRLHESRAPIWGIGRFATERYQSEFGTRRSYCNLPYFSDLERFQSALGTPKRDRVDRIFLFSGSLIPRKGVDLLGDAFVRLARELSHVRLRLLGDGELRRVLTRTLRPVSDRVEFLGYKDWPDLPTWYATADVLCVPSRYDGWGLVVPEGLASGLPVIGTDCTGAALEFIENGHNGWMVPAGDVRALFSAMHEAASLPEARLSELSRRARESVSGHSLKHGAERFIRAARDALANWHS